MQTKYKMPLILTFASVPGYALAVVNLGEAIDTLVVGGDVLTKFIWAVSIVVGIALLAAAFTQFQIHRQNPKIVPLATPVMYVVLGICLITIPFFDRVTKFFEGDVKRLRGGPAQTEHRVTPESLGGKPSAPQRPRPDPNDIDSPIY